MAATEVVQRRWAGLAIVAAPGPALTAKVAEACKGHTVVAVGAAWQRLPWADVLYACDARWWDAHKGAPGFAGEKWSLHCERSNKLETAKKYGLRLVASKIGKGFSLDPAVIHEGRNSGYQAVNLAILMGGNPIVLVGFDMRGNTHFCERPKGVVAPKDYSVFASAFDEAALLLPKHIKVLNATPDSKIAGFRRVELDDVLVRKAA